MQISPPSTLKQRDECQNRQTRSVRSPFQSIDQFGLFEEETAFIGMEFHTDEDKELFNQTQNVGIFQFCKVWKTYVKGA